MVTSGVVGWIRKRRRREEQGMSFYRGAVSTLRLRIRKKLLDPVTWFKGKAESANDEIKVEKRDTRKKRKIEELEDRKRKRDPTEAKAVMFCPYTPKGELAKRLREVETKLEPLSGFRLKKQERK